MIYAVRYNFACLIDFSKLSLDVFVYDLVTLMIMALYSLMCYTEYFSVESRLAHYKTQYI